MSKALDLRNISFEQSTNGALSGLMGVFLTHFGGLIYVAGGNTTDNDKIVTAGWKLELRREPNLRIVIRELEPTLFGPVRDVLRTLGLTVNSMRDLKQEVDYLVVLI